MAQATPDLTEDQIEQLLSAAENALPDKPAAKAVKVKATQQKSLPPAASTAPAAQPAVDSAGKDVTLRVPQPKLKEKKVCWLPIPSKALVFFMMKANPKHE